MGRSRRRWLLVLGVGVASWAFAVTAAAAHSRTPAQIRAAVNRARHARTLWATVNICDTPHFPHVIGIRAQMPSLGFGEQLQMAFAVDYFSSANHRFRRVPGTVRTVGLGRAHGGTHQAGWRYNFSAGAGRLRGTVSFTWKLGGRVVGRAQRTTTAGHPRADFADPPHHSAGECTIT